MIALAGGAAGAYATVSPRLSVGLVGVAIATALVPPLSTCSICLARGETRLAFGGFLLFFANFVAIQFASSVVMFLHGYHKMSKQTLGRRLLAERNGLTFVLLIGLACLLGVTSLNPLPSNPLKPTFATSWNKNCGPFPAFIWPICVSNRKKA